MVVLATYRLCRDGMRGDKPLMGLLLLQCVAQTQTAIQCYTKMHATSTPLTPTTTLRTPTQPPSPSVPRPLPPPPQSLPLPTQAQPQPTTIRDDCQNSVSNSRVSVAKPKTSTKHSSQQPRCVQTSCAHVPSFCMKQNTFLLVVSWLRFLRWLQLRI